MERGILLCFDVAIPVVDRYLLIGERRCELIGVRNSSNPIGCYVD